MSVIQLVVLCLLEIFSARDKKKIQVKYITFGGIERFENMEVFLFIFFVEYFILYNKNVIYLWSYFNP